MEAVNEWCASTWLQAKDYWEQVQVYWGSLSPEEQYSRQFLGLLIAILLMNIWARLYDQRKRKEQKEQQAAEFFAQTLRATKRSDEPKAGDRGPLSPLGYQWPSYSETNVTPTQLKNFCEEVLQKQYDAAAAHAKQLYELAELCVEKVDEAHLKILEKFLELSKEAVTAVATDTTKQLDHSKDLVASAFAQATLLVKTTLVDGVSGHNDIEEVNEVVKTVLESVMQPEDDHHPSHGISYHDAEKLVNAVLGHYATKAPQPSGPCADCGSAEHANCGYKGPDGGN